MIRFSANLGFLWPELPLLERIEAACRAGFSAIELHWPYDTPAEAIAERCDALGLTLLGLNTAVGDAGGGEFGLGALPRREEEFAAAVEEALGYCRITGARMVHAMAGVAAGPEAFDTLVGNIRQAARRAKEDGVTLLLEPINSKDKPGYFYATPAEAVRVIDAIGEENVRLMFDTYHVGLSGAHVVAELEAHLPLVGHVQIAAVPSRNEPDRGTVDHARLLRRLDELGYGGWIGCEYRPATSTDAGLGWVERLGFSLTQESLT